MKHYFLIFFLIHAFAFTMEPQLLTVNQFKAHTNEHLRVGKLPMDPLLVTAMGKNAAELTIRTRRLMKYFNCPDVYSEQFPYIYNNAVTLWWEEERGRLPQPIKRCADRNWEKFFTLYEEPEMIFEMDGF